jgi:WD40 repeat protein
LTLTLPFDAPTTAGVFQRILGGQWTPPSSAQRRLPRDLLVILATALEPDRDRRYQTALAFAEDLRRYRQHETILARPAGRSLRLRRWAQRNPVTAVSLGASFLILTTALAISLALLRRVQRESEARAAALRREEGTRLALQSASLLSTNPGQALLLALEAAERAPSLEANNALLRAVQSSRERARLFGHTGWVRQAAFAADGSRLATASRDRTARVWDVRTGRTLAIARGHTGQVWTAELSPDGERLLTAAEDRTARIWDARTGEERLRLIGHEHGVASARHSPDGSQILTVGHATARLWDAATAQARHVLAAHTGEIRKATFHPGGTRVATGSADRNAILWDAHTGQSLHVLAGHLAAVNDVRFSGDGKRLITGADDGGVRIWDADNGLLVVELKGHKHSIRAALLSSDGSMAATGSDDFKAVLWDVESGKARFELGHDSRVTSLELSPDGRLLLSASYDSKARVWGTRSGKLLRTFSGHSGIIIHAAFSPGCDLVATSSVDHTARIWSLHAEWPRNATSALAGNPESASLDPTGERVVAILASALNEAQVLRLEPDARPIKLAGHAGPITFLQFSPDGQSVLTTSQDATARLWSCADGALRRELLGHTGPVLRSSFSADGKRIATASEDRSVRLWDAGSGAELVRITGAQKPYHVASLSPDGAHVLCGARDSSLVLAAAGTGAVLRAFDPVEEHLLTAEWTPDGRRMVVADTTHRVKVWDPFDGASMATLVHPSRVILALPSPDGRWIATACQDLIVRLWDAHTLEETLHAQVDGTIGKELSFDGRGRWFAVYGFEVYTSQVSDGAQKGRLMLFPLDPRAEAERLRPGELTPDERDQYRVGSAEERARRRAAWQGGEVYGVRSVAPPER